VLIIYADATADILRIPRVAELPRILAYLSSLSAIQRVYPGIPDWLCGIPIPTGTAACYLVLPYGRVYCAPSDAIIVARSLVTQLIGCLRTESGSLDPDKVLSTPDLVKGLFFDGHLLDWITAEANTGKKGSQNKPVPQMRAMQWLTLLNICQGSPEGAILLTQNLTQGELNWLLIEMSLTPEMRQLRDFEEQMPSDLSAIQAKALAILSSEEGIS